jgi:hypothetical protein
MNVGLFGDGKLGSAKLPTVILYHDFSRIPIDTSVVAYRRAKYGCEGADQRLVIDYPHGRLGDLVWGATKHNLT